MKIYSALCLGLLLCLEGCHSLATPSNKKPPRKGYRVCTSSPCNSNGSELFLDALQSLATEDTTIKEEHCLGGCCTGTVVKPIALNARRRTFSVISDEETALEMAKGLLREVDGLDTEKWETLIAKMEEHTSELQSHHDLVCRLLLEKKKKQ